MKLRFLPFVLILFSASLLNAQIDFIWVPESAPGCAPGSTVNTTQGITWGSVSDCVDAELNATGSEITFTAADPTATYIRTTNVSAGSGNNTVPGTASDLQILNFQVTGDVGVLSDVLPSTALLFIPTSSGTQQMIFDLTTGLLPCPILVRGGAPIYVMSVNLNLKSGAAASSFTLGLEYSVTPSFGAELNEVVVPDSDFNGTSYEHTLPAGIVNVYPNNSQYFIGLENNTPDKQDINIYKTGGALVFAGWATLNVQRSDVTMETHDVSVALDSVILCLGASEFIVGQGATLSMANTPVNYGSSMACIGTSPGARIRVPESQTQAIGLDGEGMQLWSADAVVEVSENASLSIGNRFYMKNDGIPTYIDVLPGGSVTIDATASRSSSNRGQDGSIVVRLHDDATFDMSQASLDVQRLFTFESVVSTQHTMPDGTYTAAPNPAVAGLTYVRMGSDARELVRLEVIDMAGRVISAQRPQTNSSVYPVQLPSAGLYTVRLTDVEGRVGHLRIVGQ